MLTIVALRRNQWRRLRRVRLTALGQSPEAFLGNYAKEIRFRKKRWEAEFRRGEWYIGLLSGRPVSLLGVTREGRTPGDTRYLEYLWVDMAHRRCGLGASMMTDVLARLREAGMRTALLWVLDGNVDAVELYKRLNFAVTGESNELGDLKPGRREDQMQLELI